MAYSPFITGIPGQDPYGPVGTSPFPDLPRPDCQYTPTVPRIQKPLLPKPKWTGASSYDDPAYPHGGGPDDVPVAPPSIGQATPAAVTSPAAPAAGGGGAASNDAVLGVIQGPCEPGPVFFNRIQVFDDGTWSAVPEPGAEEKTQSFGFSDIDPYTFRITIPDHGFGIVGSKVTLRFDINTGTAPDGLTTGESYSFTIVSASVLDQADITSQGSPSFTGTLFREKIPPYLTGYILDRY